MSGVISRSEARITVAGGAAVVVGADEDGRTRLQTLHQRDPLRVLFPNTPAGEPLNAVLVNTAGGLVGGDRLSVAVEAGPHTAIQAAAGAAEKVYRSAGPDCQIDVSLLAGRASWLEWLPQETIVFDGARVRRATVIDAAAGARVLAGEIIVLGRIAMGERVKGGLIRDAWEVRADGRAVWADAFHAEGRIDEITAHPAGLGGAVATATAVYVGADAPDLLVAARALADVPPGVRFGATMVNGVLVCRWLGTEALALRQSFGGLWADFRAAAGGWPGCLPTLWNI